jgi:hypothetical protein
MMCMTCCTSHVELTSCALLPDMMPPNHPLESGTPDFLLMLTKLHRLETRTTGWLHADSLQVLNMVSGR